MDKLLVRFLAYLPRIPVALLIFFIGWILAKLWSRFFNRVRPGGTIDPLVKKYVDRIVFLLITVIAGILALSQLGLNIGPFLAGIGAGGLIIAFGVRDVIADFINGVMISVYRPFRNGDYVKIGGAEGRVEATSIVNVILRTYDGKEVLVPNHQAWGQVIINYSWGDLRSANLQIAAGGEIPELDRILRSGLEGSSGTLESCLLTGISAGLPQYTARIRFPKGDYNALLSSALAALWKKLREENVPVTAVTVTQ